MVATSYLTLPAWDVIPVTKADSDLPAGTCKAILIGTSGTLNVQMRGIDGVPVIRSSLPLEAGVYPFQCIQIRTGGTADNIHAIY
jgi:hypothetical protein